MYQHNKYTQVPSDFYMYQPQNTDIFLKLNINSYVPTQQIHTIEHRHSYIPKKHIHPNVPTKRAKDKCTYQLPTKTHVLSIQTLTFCTNQA